MPSPLVLRRILVVADGGNKVRLEDNSGVILLESGDKLLTE
jgi:hypothetical protein